MCGGFVMKGSIMTVIWKVTEADILSRGEVEEIWSQLCLRSARSRNARQSRVIFCLAAFCGLRVSEICGLRICDAKLTISRPVLEVRSQIAKQHRRRSIPLWRLPTALTCLALVGGVCGFLPFNRHPAKIFMGDAGSMTLGFVSAAIMMLLARIVPRWWIAAVVVFGLPILDTGTALLRRFINKRPLFVSDRGHIYDQMIDRGIPLNKTVGICYALAGLYASLGVLTSMIQTRYAAIACVVIFLVSFLVVWRMGFLKMEGLRGAIHQKDDTDKTRS